MEKITSAKNPIIRDMRALRERKGRLEAGRFLVEGEKMIHEALGCGLRLCDVIADDSHAAQAMALEAGGVRAALVPRGLLESVCDTRTPQGICASFKLPAPLPIDDAPKRIVALDGVQDPGNVGTIWRTADAAGFQAVLLGEGCADLLSPKVQRAAMGSGFRVPFMLTDDLPGALVKLKEKGYAIVASDLRGQNFYARPDPGEKFILIIGNEARGISDAARETATMRLKLPMRGGAESLNAAVAAGILMYGLMENIQ